jgi:hypothetical protein
VVGEIRGDGACSTPAGLRLVRVARGSSAVSGRGRDPGGEFLPGYRCASCRVAAWRPISAAGKYDGERSSVHRVCCPLHAAHFARHCTSAQKYTEVDRSLEPIDGLRKQFHRRDVRKSGSSRRQTGLTECLAPQTALLRIFDDFLGSQTRELLIRDHGPAGSSR